MHLKHFFNVVCVFLIANSVFGQQSLFNIPSSEITAKNKVFLQQQLNISSSIQSNTNFCYGLSKTFEIGINVTGFQSDIGFRKIKINDSLDGEPIAPLAMITLQKAFEINKHLKFGLGTQLGTNFLDNHNRLLADFTYLNSLVSLCNNKIKMNAGVFYGDKAFVGKDSEMGYMFGYEATLNKKIHLVADHIAGKTPIGVSVIGFIYYLHPKIPISFGYQIPNSKTQNTEAFVFELTYVPF